MRKRIILGAIAGAVAAAFATPATYDDIGAKRMRKDFKIGLYNGDELVSKVQVWSVESYVASQLAKSTLPEATRQLVITMINYGDSAAAYLG